MRAVYLTVDYGGAFVADHQGCVQNEFRALGGFRRGAAVAGGLRSPDGTKGSRCEDGGKFGVSMTLVNFSGAAASLASFAGSLAITLGQIQ